MTKIKLPKIKLKEQHELDEKIAGFMRYFEIPYYEQYMVLTWEQIQKKAEKMFPEMKGLPIQMAGVIINWEGNAEMRSDVLRGHLAHMLGWLEFNYRLEFKDDQQALFQFWGSMAKYLDYLESRFKKEFKQTVEEYHHQKYGKEKSN